MEKIRDFILTRPPTIWQEVLRFWEDPITNDRWLRIRCEHGEILDVGYRMVDTATQKEYVLCEECFFSSAFITWLNEQL